MGSKSRVDNLCTAADKIFVVIPAPETAESGGLSIQDQMYPIGTATEIMGPQSPQRVVYYAVLFCSPWELMLTALSRANGIKFW